MRLTWIWFSALPCLITPAYGFDCTKASAPAETAICGNAELKKLDADLNDRFTEATGKSDFDARSKLKLDQRAWLKERNACGKDVSCLKRSISARIAALGEPAQPCIKDPGNLPPPEEGDIVSADDFEDLNGDGKMEKLQSSKFGCGSGGCGYTIYLSRGGCFVAAGSIMGALTRLQTRHYGASDLRSYWKLGCAGREGTVHFYEFDGTRYVEKTDRQIHCACNGDVGRRNALCPNNDDFTGGGAAH
ncbi:MAG: lysozyme inhibitor LprI family protein [Bdellovibrionota bacterium]